MPENEGAIPELISFIFGLILAVLHVPSIADISIVILSAFHQALPNPITPSYITMLRFVGWFLTIEVILRIIIHFQRGKYTQ